MILSPKIHVLNAYAPKPATSGVLEPPAKPIMRSTVPVSWQESKSTSARLEYENPDLTQPSVSSF